MMYYDHAKQKSLTGFGSLMLSLSLIVGLVGCGGAGKAKDELTKTAGMLDSVRKKGCAHGSLGLAEEAYAKAQKLFDEKKYDEAQAQARAAKELAAEADRANEGKPCEAPPEEPATEVKAETPVEEPEDAQMEPFTTEEAPDLKTIYFGFDSFALTADARAIIEENLQWIRDNPDHRIAIGGHCDERGTSDYNVALSERRAKVVAEYLQQAGIELRRLKLIGYGSEMPISFRRDEEGHRLNRRVEFKLVQ